MKHLTLIGYGNMGHTHLKNLKQLSDIISVRGVYDIDPQVQRQAEKDGYFVFHTLDQVLQDSVTDMVIIAVPNNFHKDISISCLAAHKHVICEKPVTLNAAELVEIITASRIYHRVFAVDQNRRWDRDYRIIKKLFDSKAYGLPYYIDTRVQGSYGLPDKWFIYKKYGGGMLLDWGVHLIDQLMWMIDSPVTCVYANMVHACGFEVEDNLKAFIRFANGIFAQIQVDTTCFHNLPRWHVQFPKATAVIQSFDDDGILYLPGGSSAQKNEGYYTGSGPTKTMVPRELVDQVPLDNRVDYDFVNGFYRNVVDAIDGRKELIVKPEQSLRVIRVLDALFESARAGCSIPCDI